MDPIGLIASLLWEAVESTLATGTEPYEEAREPAFAGPTGLCACVGFPVGGILGAAAALAFCVDHGVPRASVLTPVLAFGGLGATLGAVLGGTLRAWRDALSVFPRPVPLAVGALFGAAAGCLALLGPGVPRLEALGGGILVGVLLALLFHIFGRRLP